MFTSVSQSTKEATRSVQTFLNLLKPGSVQVDGVVGKETRNAFDLTDVKAKSLLADLAKARNPGVLDQLMSVQAASPISGHWISRAECVRMIRASINRYGNIPDLQGSSEDYLTWLLDLEPIKRSGKDGVFYDADSRHGSFLGLYQIGPSAWKDVSSSGRVKDMGSLSTGAFLPALNTDVALVYSQILVGYLRKGYRASGVFPYKGDITKEVLYGAHNQGAVGLLKASASKAVPSGQSKVATKVIAVAMAQIGSAST